MTANENAPKGRQGFASMTPERRREIASKGGKAAHAQGKAHTWTAEQAKEAGRKGGTATQERLRALASCEGCGVALAPVMPTACDDCREEPAQ
jgi:uncharacterized protein